MDDELELQNFKQAAEVLADVWTHHVIDNHPVTSVASFDLGKGSCMHAAIYVANSNTEVLRQKMLHP